MALRELSELRASERMMHEAVAALRGRQGAGACKEEAAGGGSESEGAEHADAPVRLGALGAAVSAAGSVALLYSFCSTLAQDRWEEEGRGGGGSIAGG